METPKDIAAQDQIKSVAKESQHKESDAKAIHQSTIQNNPAIQDRARELLKVDDKNVDVPDEIYANAIGGAKKDIRKNYLARRRLMLEALAGGYNLFISTDADGTCTFKTVQKVENTRSIGSLYDKHFLRLFLKGIAKLGNSKFEVNTARTGFIPGPSLVGTEGPAFKGDDGKIYNPRSPNEISSIMHEFGIHSLDNPESKEIFDVLAINGLSAGVTHKSDQAIKINPKTIKYGEAIRQLEKISLPGAEKGFLAKLEEIIANKDEAKPLKVLEYKSIPWIFIEHPDFKVEHYVRYIDIVEKSRTGNWSAETFFDKLNNSHVELPKEYYDPENPPKTEQELTHRVRDAMIACLTPHAFDSLNIVRDDRKEEIYKQLARFMRSPEMKAWAQEKYGIPPEKDLFTINGKDVSHIDFDNFKQSYKNFGEMKDDLKEKGRKPENADHVLINVIENDQPYCEIAPNTSKGDVLPSKDITDKNNYFVIGAGDSPGSDAPLLGESILLGGAGFIVRGLMDENDVSNAIVEGLAKEKYSWHPMALEELPRANKDDEPEFKNRKTGEVKLKSEWAKVALEKYNDKIFRCNNIHENNAFNAAIMSEFFKGDKDFSLQLNEDSAFAKEVLKNTNQRSLVTPRTDSSDKALEGQVYEKSLLEKSPLLAKIPLVRDLFDPHKAGPSFDRLLKGVSWTLIGATPFAFLGSITKNTGLERSARLVQRFAYGANALASGVSRGLFLSAHKFNWQFIGELFNVASSFFPAENSMSAALRALGQSVLIGRGNELAMRTNYNLDSFNKKDKETQEAIKKDYTGDGEAYKNKRKVMEKFTIERDKMLTKLQKGPLGKVPLLAGGVADFAQGIKLTKDFLTIPALRKNTLKNFFTFGAIGPKKVSKNSGKTYGEVHEENTYASVGMASIASVFLGTALKKITGQKWLETIFDNLGTILPGLGIVTAGKLVHQDQDGSPRLFTNINKKQAKYSPEKSGLLQMASGWLMSAAGIFKHTKLGSAVYDMANGIYFLGIREQIKGGVDDAAVNLLTRQGKYYKAEDNSKGNTGAVLAKIGPSGIEHDFKSHETKQEVKKVA